MTYSKELTRSQDGEAEISGFPSLKFSTAQLSEVSQSVGDPVYNPATGTKERLPGEPEMGTLTLAVAESPFSRNELEKLHREAIANPGKLWTVAIRKGGRTRVVQGRLSTATIDSGFDKNAQLTSSGELSATFELTKREPLV